MSIEIGCGYSGTPAECYVYRMQIPIQTKTAANTKRPNPR